MLYALAVAAILVTLAELGDKTQLLALALACRYKPRHVMAGIFIAVLVLCLLATLAGQLVGSFIPKFWLSILTGVLFLGFGVWTLIEKDAAEEHAAEKQGRFGPILTVAGAFFLAELGDKTQILTMTIAADPSAVLRSLGAAGPSVSRVLGSLGLTGSGPTGIASFLGVWFGATLGMMLVDGVAVLVGSALGKRLPEKAIKRVSGVVFIIFGLVTLVGAFFGAS